MLVATAVLGTSASCSSKHERAVTSTSVTTSAESTSSTAESADDATALGTTTTSATTSSGTTPATAASTDVFTAAGIAVVADEAAGTTSGALTFTSVQAERMLREADVGGGFPGASLDALAPMPAGAPPVSYLIAGWVTTAETPGGDAARAWLGEQDWTRAAEIVFPTAVIALFAADMLQRIDQALPADEGVTPGSGAPPASADGLLGARTPLAAPCSTVTSFISGVLTAVVTALRVQPVQIESIGDVVLNILGAAWNRAVEYARGVVEGVIASITQPVFDAIRAAIGVLSIATLVTSYARDLTVTVTLEPAQSDTSTYRFAIDQEPDRRASFVARVQDLADDWPAFLRDCAAASGAPLPQVVRAGDPATWSVDAGGVIAPDRLETTVAVDRAVRLGFVTGRETSEDAKGDETFGAAIATVNLSRKELGDFMRLVHDQVTSARTLLINQFPAPLRSLVDLALRHTLDPIVAQLEQEIGGIASPLFALRGSRTVYVLHHKPPDTTTTSSTEPPVTVTQPPPDTADDEGDFCARWADLLDETPQADVPGDPSAFAAELEAIRPLAPAELIGDVDIGIAFYRGVDLAANTDPGTIYILTREWAFASDRIQTFCGTG